jgi:hypothetical protein
VNGRELFDRDSARFVEPSQIGGQIGNRRFQEHPAACLVHLAEAVQYLGIGVRRRMVEERPQIGVGADAVRAHQRRGAGEQRQLTRIGADPGESGQLLERLLERNGG